MYSKEESARIKTEFWTSLGQYLKPIPSTWKEKVNWLNYKTGIKDVYFRMHADRAEAAIAIELTHKDTIIREIVFEKFEQLRSMLEAETGESWNWHREWLDDHGSCYSRIEKKLHGVNIMKREDWPTIISFFKPRMLALDRFWGDARDIVEMAL